MENLNKIITKNSINNFKKTVVIMKKEMYVAPELEVLEVMVEQGFAGSGDSSFDTEGGIEL